MATVPLLLLLLSAQSRQSTFHMIEKKMNQAAARDACGRNFTDLVTVYTEEQNDRLAQLTQSWIGLYRNGSSEKWSNGDPVTFNNLSSESRTSDLFCAAVKADGLWESIQCTEKKHFMCYKEGVASAAPEYHLISNRKSWCEAQSFCRRNFTDLVSINNPKQNEEVKKKGEESRTPFWIGLLRDQWLWADGGCSAYRNWSSDQPKGGDCVIMKQGGWFSVPCTNEEFPLCSSSSIYVSSEKMNWEDALYHCEDGNRSGILLVKSKTLQDEVEEELTRRRVREPVWVGLRQSILFGFWLWTDGSAAYPYTKWYDKEPEHQNSHYCGTMDPQRDFTWRDRDCESTFRVLCRV